MTSMPLDTRTTAAEIAVGIAGFTAIVVALGKIGLDTEHGWLPPSHQPMVESSRKHRRTG